MIARAKKQTNKKKEKKKEEPNLDPSPYDHEVETIHVSARSDFLVHTITQPFKKKKKDVHSYETCTCTYETSCIHAFSLNYIRAHLEMIFTFLLQGNGIVHIES